MTEGFIYFIQEEETGRIKIGFSEKHPKGRLQDFQTGNSNKLNLIGYIEGTYEDETILHQEFSEERIRKDNEWFKSSPRLTAKIKELMEASLDDKKKGIEVLNRETIILEVSGIDSLKKRFGEDYEQRYEGELEDGVPNGQGTVTIHPIGTVYTGEWKDGEPNGQGTITYQDGSEYEGEFNGWLYHGQGILIDKNGVEYVGEFKDGLQHGQGIETVSDGYKYEGEWENGGKNGRGTCTWSDGWKYEGEFKDGLFHGLGTLFTSEGSKCVCDEWKEGKENGKVIWIFSHGDMSKSFYEDGELISEIEMTYTNGDKYIGDINDDNKFWNGKYFIDGKLHYEYVNGKKKAVSVFRRLMTSETKLSKKDKIHDSK